MAFNLALEFSELRQDLLIAGQSLAHVDESSDHEDAHFDGALGIQDGGGHDGAVFGEGVGKMAAPAVT